MNPRQSSKEALEMFETIVGLEPPPARPAPGQANQQRAVRTPRRHEYFEPNHTIPETLEHGSPKPSDKPLYPPIIIHPPPPSQPQQQQSQNDQVKDIAAPVAHSVLPANDEGVLICCPLASKISQYLTSENIPFERLTINWDDGFEYLKIPTHILLQLLTALPAPPNMHPVVKNSSPSRSPVRVDIYDSPNDRKKEPDANPYVSVRAGDITTATPLQTRVPQTDHMANMARTPEKGRKLYNAPSEITNTPQGGFRLLSQPSQQGTPRLTETDRTERKSQSRNRVLEGRCTVRITEIEKDNGEREIWASLISKMEEISGEKPPDSQRSNEQYYSFSSPMMCRDPQPSANLLNRFK
jgi:hypothetical protein